MIRIHIHYAAATTRFIVEGKLAWPWVEELERCWKAALSTEPRQFIQVNLVDVVFVDDRGKELLAMMHEQGKEVLANPRVC